MPNLKTAHDKHLYSPQDITEAKEKFNRHIIDENAIATNNIRAEKFDMDKAKQKSSDALIALDVNGGLQSMLAAQMLSIHELQQRTMAYANAIDSLELKKYYTNTAVKLANCFVQQATILAKLQGVGGQKIIVERVDVHQGGQAVVGNIQGGMGKR
ncbi:hypothetical protein TUM19329_06700 [Legionella antarctica]|uniref:Uncharacterized protein n=1 Tax=Legionella antarctica TaxID=2708020 RepID=A0A6F8T1J9_9GAMM|nr:hypothetical protein [Legionella antarctica]BCA94309.1 hypothetical protein TUM19329_06700 [Legionella antarctica]